MSPSAPQSESVKLVVETDHAEKRSPDAPASQSSSRASVPEAPTSISRALMLCAFYGSVSVSITFFNKAIFKVYDFNFPCFVTLVQMLVCISFLVLAHLFGFLQLPQINRKTSRQVFPLSLVWWLYVVSGIGALRYLTIPMFSTLRKSTAFIVLVLERIILRKRAKPSVWLAILIMVGGGFIAGMTDLSFSPMGYFLVSLCCVATALYLVLIVRVTKMSRLGTFSLLFYNNILALPLMVGYIVFFTHELENVAKYPNLYDKRFWAFLILSAGQATLLNIAIFLCTKLNSPLATTVTGQVKDFLTVGFGLFVFGDVTLSVPNLIGLLISMMGSVIYSIIKLIGARTKSNASSQSK